MGIFKVKTKKRRELVDITPHVKEAIKKSGARDGLVLVFTPHSTAGVLITENESGLKKDILEVFQSITEGFDFSHDRIDDNASAHILSALTGQGRVFPLEEGVLQLGTWQQIFLVELDGPRERRVIVKVAD